jgi:squamous cell carcinoma antigen recognized by T-cells 3
VAAHLSLLRKQGRHDQARATFKDLTNKYLDWPEAIWEAWIAFEHLNGSVQDLEVCLDRVERARAGVNARRAKVRLSFSLKIMVTFDTIVQKEAESASYLAIDVAASVAAEPATNEVTAIQIDNDTGKNKRKLVGDANVEGNKKARTR